MPTSPGRRPGQEGVATHATTATGRGRGRSDTSVRLRAVDEVQHRPARWRSSSTSPDPSARRRATVAGTRRGRRRRRRRRLVEAEQVGAVDLLQLAVAGDAARRADERRHRRASTARRVHRRLRRDAHDEAGAAARAVLDPRLAALGRGVLGDERQPEAGADAVAGRAAPGEALEDAHPLAAGDARAGVLHGDEQERAVGRARSRCAPARRRGGRRSPAGWRGSARSAACRRRPSAARRCRRGPATSIGQVGEAVAGGDPGAQGGDVDLLECAGRSPRRRCATARAGR